MILNVNPLAPMLADSFRPDAIYQLKIDTDGDAIANIAFPFLFSEVEDGKQVAEVRLATGDEAASANSEGRVDLKTRSGTVTKAVFAGDPEAMSAIALPGHSRIVRVIGVQQLNRTIHIKGVIDTRSRLLKNERRDRPGSLCERRANAFSWH